MCNNWNNLRGEKMFIGYMRNTKKPGKMAKEIANICKENGMDLLYFTAKGLNRKTGKVKGQVLLSEGWTTTIAELPNIVDISPLCIKHRKQVKYLQDNCILTDNMENLLSKESVYELTIDHEVLESIATPTKRINSHIDILDYVRDYDKVKVQALYKKDYNGDYYIYYEDRKVNVLEDDQWTSYELPEFEEWYHTISDNKAYIVQKHLESQTRSNIPFHFRVNLDKNADNTWGITEIFTNLTNTTNKDKIDYQSFLHEHYDVNTAKQLQTQLIDFSILFALQVEEYRKYNLMTLGIDFGVTNDGQIFIIDANNSPGTVGIQDEVAGKRVNYYQYLAEKHLLHE